MINSKYSLRILFLTITFDPEPAQHGLPLAKWMKDRGHDVKVLTCFPQYPLGKIYPGYKMHFRQWEIIDNIPILRVPIYPSHDSSALRRITTYISFMATATFIGIPLIGKADVLFLYEPPPTNGIAALTSKLFRGTPIVHHIADMWPETIINSGIIKGKYSKMLVSFIIKKYCKLLYNQAKFITVLSPGFKKLLIERGVHENKIKIIYNWADESKFRPMEKDIKLQNNLQLNGYFNFIYAGNIGPLQNIETIIRAADLLRNYPEIQIVIIGTGPKEKSCKKLAKELNTPNIRFIERQPYNEMPRIYSLADVLLIHLRDYPFLHSTIPSKTQVGMLCGRPILMGVKGDAADLLLRSGGGITCEPENPKSMADAMHRLYKMPRKKLEDMGNKGKTFYKQKLNMDASAAIYEKLFFQSVRSKKHK